MVTSLPSLFPSPDGGRRTRAGTEAGECGDPAQAGWSIEVLTYPRDFSAVGDNAELAPAIPSALPRRRRQSTPRSSAGTVRQGNRSSADCCRAVRSGPVAEVLEPAFRVDGGHAAG